MQWPMQSAQNQLSEGAASADHEGLGQCHHSAEGGLQGCGHHSAQASCGGRISQLTLEYFDLPMEMIIISVLHFLSETAGQTSPTESAQ